MPLKVACAQFAPEKAEVARNLDKIAEIIGQAIESEVDLLLLPEASTSGYFLEGGVLEASLTVGDLCQSISSRMVSSHRPLDVCLGFYENHEGALYNSAAYLAINERTASLQGVYRKFFLPTYGVFDEERFVSSGRDLCVIESRFGRLAILICEDVWHSILPTLCAVRGAQLLLVPAASPARGFSGSDIDNHERYRRLFQGISEEHGLYCLNAQLCGFEGGKGFIGGSMIIDPLGKVQVQAVLGEESLLVADIDLELISIARANSPLLTDLRSAWGDIRRLVDAS
jgi:N-carbamoylputrescine amidase